MTFMRLSGFQVQGEKGSVVATNQSGVNKSAGEIGTFSLNENHFQEHNDN